MISGEISRTNTWRFGVDIDTKLNVDAVKSVALQRGSITLRIGGIYKSKSDSMDYELIEYLSDINIAVFRNINTKDTLIHSVHDFENVTDKHGSTLQRDIDSISDEYWQKANDKYRAIRPLLGGNPEYFGEKGYLKRSKETGASTRSLKRWINLYRSTNSIASLLDKKRGWKTGNNRIDKNQDIVIDKAIREFYLTKQRPTVQATIREVVKRCNQLKISHPSQNTIRRRISKLSEEEYLKGRGQRKTARQKFEQKSGHFPDADFPLAAVQIDHTPMDVIIVDDKYRHPIGRPFLTMAIDVYSRMIMGYYISLDAPSVTSVAMCLSRSILAKDELLLDFELQDAKWNAFGFPKKIHVDNGSDFRANSLKKSCLMHGIDIEFRPVRVPEYGGHIERLLGTVMSRVHELPGTTFSNITERAEYDSEKHAALTLNELEKWLLIFITKVYHEKIHSTIDRTPKEQWKIGIYGNGFEEGVGLPAMASDKQTVILDFMPSFERTIQRNGVTIEGVTYYDPELNTFINLIDPNNKSKKQKFTFRRDPRDISNIWFFHPIRNQYYNIPVANQSFPSMSIWVYKELQKKVKQDKGTVNEHLIIEGWELMDSVVSEAKKNTKSLRRKEQRRKAHKKSQKAYASIKQESKMETKTSQSNQTSNLDSRNGDYILDDSVDMYYDDIR